MWVLIWKYCITCVCLFYTSMFINIQYAFNFCKSVFRITSFFTHIPYSVLELKSSHRKNIHSSLFIKSLCWSSTKNTVWFKIEWSLFSSPSFTFGSTTMLRVFLVAFVSILITFWFKIEWSLFSSPCFTFWGTTTLRVFLVAFVSLLIWMAIC